MISEHIGVQGSPWGVPVINTHTHIVLIITSHDEMGRGFSSENVLHQQTKDRDESERGGRGWVKAKNRKRERET